MSDLQKFFTEHKKEIVALGKKHGCTFTEDDVVAMAEGQLSEEQLDGAAGGLAAGGVAIIDQYPKPIRPVLPRPGLPGDPVDG